MIGVVLTFRSGDAFDEQAIREIAETARARLEGMPGLCSKLFTYNSAKREAANFYMWESEEPRATAKYSQPSEVQMYVKSANQRWLESPSHPTPPRSSSHLTSVSGTSGSFQSDASQV